MCDVLVGATDHFLATGDAYSAGWNHVGQCGTGDTLTCQVTRLALTDVIQCAAGDSHSLFLDRKSTCHPVQSLTRVIGHGHVYGCGSNQFGQLGHVIGPSSHTPTRIESLPVTRVISVGAHHSVIVTGMSNSSLDLS